MKHNWDVIVVGSGFGGSITAARLSQGGRRVLVLERGPWWGRHEHLSGPDEFSPHPRGLWGSRKLLRNVRFTDGHRRSGEALVHRDGLYEIHRFSQLTVFNGSGVGGGSHVYGGIQREPSPAFWDAFPPEFTAQSMATYFDRVRAVQTPSPSPRPDLSDRTISRAFRATGLNLEIPDMAIDRDACVGCGLCVLGCTHEAKITLDRTYLKVAINNGAHIRALHEVKHVSATDDGYRVSGIDHRSRVPFEAAAPQLVLAAGTLNSVQLLFAARDQQHRLPNVSSALGSGFTGNADYPVVVHRKNSPQPSSRTLVNTAATKDGLYFLDVDMPIPGTAMLVGMGGEPARGRMTNRAGRLSVQLEPRQSDDIYARMDRDIAAIKLATPDIRKTHGFRRLLSAHPLGGAPIATDPTRGVVDHAGNVFGHPGLFVADGSVLPAAPGVPPSLTIAALAERQTEIMLAQY